MVGLLHFLTEDWTESEKFLGKRELFGHPEAFLC